MTYDDTLALRMKLNENFWVPEPSKLFCVPVDGMEERDDVPAAVVERALQVATMLAFHGLAATHVLFGREDDPEDVILLGDDPDILLLQMNVLLKDGWEQPARPACRS